MTSSLGGAALQSISISMLAVSDASHPRIPGTAKQLEASDQGNSFVRYNPKLHKGRVPGALGPNRAS
jgi:hypothetical protein